MTHAHPTHIGTGTDTDTCQPPPQAPGTSAVTHGHAPATVTEPLTHLTHDSPS